ncbi:MAG: hypothetical protein FWD53_11790, partial [Phycisphaerales bacterium]|nr:hypothetical protein [Phycisphaerales bacterium]
MNNIFRSLTLILFSITLTCCGVHAPIDASSNAVKPLELTAHATIHCIGVQWHLEGDANANATGTMQFRETGTTAWKAAYPLYRAAHRPDPNVHVQNSHGGLDKWTPGFRNYAINRLSQNYLAGSIINLKPATKYDVKVTIRDPDGGGASKTIQVTTRPIPAWYDGGNTIIVQGGGDALKDAVKNAKPGDILCVHPGKYNGGIKIENSGTVEKPIYIAAVHGISGSAIIWARPGEVLLDGGDAPKANIHGFEISGSYVYIDRLSFRNFNNCVRVNAGANNVAVMNCKMDYFYTAIKSFGDDGYFADNTIRWSYNATDHSLERSNGSEGHGVELGLATKGNVICYNAISCVSDAIRAWGRDTDVYGNDVIFCVDDFIELDAGGPN